MEVKLLLFVCLIGIPFCGLSQEKAQPPSPVVTETMKDTLQERHRRPRLELPDVVIYGEDLVILARERVLYDSQIESETRKAEKRLAGRRIGVKTPKFSGIEPRRLVLTHLRAQYGSYSSHQIEAANSSRIGDLDYTIRLSHSKKGEWVENSESNELESNLKIDWSVNHTSLISTMEYGRVDFGYYGESTQDRGSYARYSVREQLFLPDLELTASVSVSRKDSSPKDRFDNREASIELSGKSQHEFESIPLRSEVSYVHTGGDGFLDIFHVGFYSFFSPHEWLNESFGLEYVSANRTKRISPFAKIDMNLGIGFFASYRSFIEPHTMIEQVHSEPLVRYTEPIAEEHLNSLTLGVCHGPKNGIRTQFTVNYEDLKNKPFWQYDNGWVLGTMDTKRTSMQLDLTGRLLEFLFIDFSLRYLLHSTAVPYTSSVAVEARAQYDTELGIEIEGIGTYVGKRDTPLSQLPAYAKFDLNLRKNVLRNLEAFGGIKNILNTKYEILLRYLEPGREVYFGARFLL